MNWQNIFSLFALEELTNSTNIPQGGQQIIINQVEQKSNGVGIAGFVLAIITIFWGWIPVLGWILWVLGLILSFAGIFKKPRRLAVVGLVLSLIDLILLIVVFGAIPGGIGILGAL